MVAEVLNAGDFDDFTIGSTCTFNISRSWTCYELIVFVCIAQVLVRSITFRPKSHKHTTQPLDSGHPAFDSILRSFAVHDPGALSRMQNDIAVVYIGGMLQLCYFLA